ncbi:MAG: response regulator [Clostridia bacterium]|nr:response regulator [Clostridia bacterium]
MKIICVDDEVLLLEDTVAMCLKLPQVEEAKGFTNPCEALTWLTYHPADIALLDIDMPGMNGMMLAAEIKRKYPHMAIIFLTGYSQYAVEAFSMRASGYLLKPVTQEKLAADVAYALSIKPKKLTDHVVIRTFGNFDVFVDDKLVVFKSARGKELLAYLVDRQGSSVTRAEAFAILWEDRLYDRPMQKQMDAVIRNMRETLREYGIEDIFDMKNGSMWVCPARFTCDAYLFLKGDVEALNAYRGEYMSAYAWASMTESVMTWKQMNGN